jgi:hypothetical protein
MHHATKRVQMVVVMPLAMNSNIMKKTILFTALAASLLVACRKTNDPAVYALGVDVQASFNQDNVQVNIDGQPLLNHQVSTSQLLGLASSVSTTNAEGDHTIQVIVNDSTIYTQNFSQKGDLYIGINYNHSTNSVALKFSATRFVYL